MPEERGPDRPLPLARALTPAERERTIEQLTVAFAHDLVPLDEFERRVALAYSAASPAELRALTDDLAMPAPGAAVAPVAGAMQRVGGVLANVERRGAQVIGPKLDVRSFLANVELDLTRARLSAPVTEIDIRCVLGNVEIRLPAGVDIENHGSGFLGSFECRDAIGRTAPNAPVIRILGHATLGSVSISVDEGEN